MTSDERMPTWRNALIWAAVSFPVYLVYALVVSAFLQGGLRGPAFQPGFDAGATAVVALSLVVGSAVSGLSQRKVRFGARAFRNFTVLSTLAIGVFLLVRWVLADAISLQAIGTSATVALIVGVVLLVMALVGLLCTASAHARLGLVPAEQAELLVERGRVLPMSLVVVAAMGLVLVVLSLAGPGGPLAPSVALAGVAVLLAIEVGLSLAVWPRLDELSQTLSRESGNAAYYLIVTFGGGWAVLAQLRLVPAPAPLDWLTMFTVIAIAASMIAAGRRGMLEAV